MGKSEAVMLTADIVVLAPVDGELCVLVIKRGNEPFKGSWGLPGGKVHEDEAVLAAAHRELKEEAGIEVPALLQIGVYDAPGRDPRGRFVSTAFTARLPHAVDAVAGDDAAEVRWVSVYDVANEREQLAFDHCQIMIDAMFGPLPTD